MSREIADLERSVISIVRQLLERRNIHMHVAASDNLGEVGLSSFDSVSLLLAIEEKFGINFPDEQINAKNFQSAEVIARLICRYLPNT